MSESIAAARIHEMHREHSPTCSQAGELWGNLMVTSLRDGSSRSSCIWCKFEYVAKPEV